MIFFIKLLKKISQFSSLRNIELFIYGNDQFQPEIEKEYFKNLDLKCKWKFLPNDRKISYKILDQSNLIVGTHSTLVYEALGRGAKVFVFSKKINDNLLVTHKFAWPYKLKSEGFFWSNNFLKNDNFFQKLEKIYKMDEVRWKTKVEKKVCNIMVYDELNSKFRNFLNL